MALKEKHLLDSGDQEGFLDEVSRSNSEQLEGLDQVFRIVLEADVPTDVSAIASLLSPFISLSFLRKKKKI